MKNLIVIIFASAFTGCTLLNGYKPQVTKLPEERIVNIPLEVPGVLLKGNDVGKLRTTENIKSYYIGRWIDPRNPNILHPSGVVLEVIDKPRWIMTPRSVEVPSGGPTSLAENGCTKALISEFKQDMTIIRHTVETLQQSRKELDSSRHEVRNTVSKINSTLKEIKNQNIKNNEILEKIENMNQKVSELENKFLFSKENPENQKK